MQGPKSRPQEPPELRRDGFHLPVFRRRAALYVDGFNLYHALDSLNRPHLKWLDLDALARELTPKSQRVSRVVWCSAYRPQMRAKLRRHQTYHDALEARGVVCRMGHFVVMSDGCNACGHTWTVSMEKQGDVNLALSLVADAEDDLFDVAYLMTTDGDHAATARYLKQRFPKKTLVVVAPPERRHNRFLLEWADWKTTVELDQLERALLPAAMNGPDGEAIVRPSAYDPPPEIRRGPLRLVHSAS